MPIIVCVAHQPAVCQSVCLSIAALQLWNALHTCNGSGIHEIHLFWLVVIYSSIAHTHTHIHTHLHAWKCETSVKLWPESESESVSWDRD